MIVQHPFVYITVGICEMDTVLAYVVPDVFLSVLQMRGEYFRRREQNYAGKNDSFYAGTLWK